MQAFDDMSGGGACVVVGGGEGALVVASVGASVVLAIPGGATGDVAGAKTLPLMISTP